MKINPEKCTGCRKCLPWCPGGAISMNGKKAKIYLDECTECGVCLRVGVCPADAFYQQSLEWPRSVRSIYSDPLNVHKETGLAGRGTEEIKTNDVTGRFKRGEIGFAIEIGRPNQGARLRELEKFSKVIAEAGIKFEPKNPLTNLINPTTGELPQEILNEKVISAIIEFSIPEKRFSEVMKLIDGVAEKANCVVSVDVAARVSEDGTWPTLKLLESEDRYVRPNAKINVGLGRL